MKRRRFLSVLALAPACMTRVLDALSRPKIRWACVLDRGGKYIGPKRFKDVLPGDTFTVLNPGMPVHEDPDIGRRFRAVEGPTLSGPVDAQTWGLLVEEIV